MGKLDRLQDDFSTLDTEKWSVGNRASVSVSGQLKIDMSAAARMTLLCADCHEPTLTIEPSLRIGVVLHRIDVECSCGRINTWEALR